MARHLDDILIMGAGRWYRRDDQVGLVAAERLLEMNLKGVSAATTESPGTDIASLMDGVNLLILIDGAAPTGLHGPGSWRKIDYASTPRRIRSRNLASSHSLSVDVALQMSAHLGELPGDIWIYAIAVADVGYGEAMTPSVRAAMDETVRSVARDIVEWKAKRDLSGELTRAAVDSSSSAAGR